MRLGALGLVALLAACVGEATHDRADYPQVIERYSIAAGVVACDGPAAQDWQPSGGPYTSGFCEWTCVSYGTQDYQRARVDFARPDALAPWVVAFGANTPGNCP